jgi:hypothetical protein
MKRLPICLLLLLLARNGFAQSPTDLIVLAKGTEIKLKMAQTVTSKHAYIGERVELQVADDVVAGAVLLVPKNTRVLGTVNVGKVKEGDKKNPHEVVIQIDYIRLGDRRIPLSGMHSDKGKVDKSTLAASTVLFGLTGLLIAMDSRTGEIKEGTEVKAIVTEDVPLPALGPSSAAKEQTGPEASAGAVSR